MDFRTTLQIPRCATMDYDKRYLLIGSCFAQNMGNLFSKMGFSALINPFGILYNPASIAKVLERVAEGSPFTDDELFTFNGLWHSWMHHGSFSHANKEEVLTHVNRELAAAHDQLLKLDHLIITFGSSWVYSYKKEIVANCHKIPQKEFTERRLTLYEIQKQYAELFKHLLALRPQLQITLTVSPVRYLGQGILASHTNKAILLLACESLCKEYEQVHYFPAYELLLDDLRDYRFYAEDMIHPSAQAIDYIWQNFIQTYFTKETLALLPEVEKLQRALAHRPLHPDSQQHKQFIENTQQQIDTLRKKHPLLNIK